MCGVGAGVGMQCVVCGVCDVCAWCVCVLCVRAVCVRGVCCVCGGVVCVARLGTRKNTMCRFQTSLCVGSKRLRVYWQNARMCSQHARVLPVHTEAF